MSFSSSPPPPFLSDLTSYVPSDFSAPPHASTSSSVNPSVLIIVLILFITVVSCISLCLLLRHLNRRCLRRGSSSSTTTTASTTADSHPLSARRVSPEIPRTSIADSLPLFTFSSITRRSSSTSSKDCAVCLSKFEPTDQLRFLPLCCHAFHAQCIDTWLESNQSCPLCRSAIFASESDLMKASLASSNGAAAGESFRLEIGNVSRRRAEGESGEARRSYSIGSFDYLVDEDSEISMSHAHRWSVSDKEESGALPETMEASLASEVGGGRNWLKEYVDRLSFSLSSRAMSFRSSGRFFSGSSRRSNITGAGEIDLEANRVGEEISEMFRWLSGV
ncbi:hypothetical protein FH972_011026 [Carpinus fangiana]|uniref:RING-type E3 ubiquitin transferase n=1 Tax=Carpinus fangiana TaxID=176857 RepID=A0A660KT60_9ROSI|nr:hypothetical protein FH972_011026 [Carpinus fangiana]